MGYNPLLSLLFGSQSVLDLASRLFWTGPCVLSEWPHHVWMHPNGTIGYSNSSYTFPALGLESAISPRIPSEAKIWVQYVLIAPEGVSIKKNSPSASALHPGGDMLICTLPFMLTVQVYLWGGTMLLMDEETVDLKKLSSCPNISS